jgi:hypothetical protein
LIAVFPICSLKAAGGIREAPETKRAALKKSAMTRMRIQHIVRSIEMENVMSKLRSISALACVAASIQFGTASAAQTCFTAFKGTIHYQFDGDVVSAGNHALNGVEFGALSNCAGLRKWPMVGTAVNTPTALVLGWRSFTLDAAGCGAADFIVNLSPKTLAGPLQNHNDRTNVSKTDRLVHAPCITPPAAAAAVGANTVTKGNDANGN